MKRRKPFRRFLRQMFGFFTFREYYRACHFIKHYGGSGCPAEAVHLMEFPEMFLAIFYSLMSRLEERKLITGHNIRVLHYKGTYRSRVYQYTGKGSRHE